MIKPYLYLKTVESKGRGVFTRERIPPGKTVEISPVIVMGSEDRKLLDQTLLHDYIFEWGDKQLECCMALGFIPMYNHDYRSNCEYFMDFENETIEVRTVRNIEVGEELTINYNGDWNDSRKVWFQTDQE